jgi:UDP-3-O-[3-hydroxymyristoyl] glucosamine N-acyltransferase
MYRKNTEAFPLSHLVEQLGKSGFPVRLIQSADALSRLVEGPCSLDEPINGGISFFSRTSRALLEQTLRSEAARQLTAVIISTTLLDIPPNVHSHDPIQESFYDATAVTLLAVSDPYKAFISLISNFYTPIVLKDGIHPTAIIAETATIAPNCHIGPYCIVGDHAIIESNCSLHSHVVIYEGAKIRSGTVLHSGVTVREFCDIGSGSIIQNGAVIGGDGFGYLPDNKVGLVAVSQIGTVVLEGSNDIGANTCIDRATLGTTKIGIGTKIDNLAQIGHNNHIGHNTIICGASAIAGSCNIGSEVVIGGQVGIADHITIANKVRVAGGSGVTHSLTEAGDYAGYPVIPAYKWKRIVTLLSRLPEFIRELRQKTTSNSFE